MDRATTPTHTFTLPVDTSTCTIIRVVYKQGSTKLIKEKTASETPEGMTLNGYYVVVDLTQEETLMFDSKNMVRVQLRVKTDAGKVFDSQKWAIQVDDGLDEEILE